jgi:hypothetical protein
MTNKSYAITMSLMRPSAAAQTTLANASQQPALMDRERERALSACLPFVKAAVCVAEKSSYPKLRCGDNDVGA